MFKLIYYTFIAFIILIAICLAGSMLPIPENYKIMIVQSGSMAPAIKTGSIVIVKPSPDYKAGDIITFGPYSKTKAPTTHRIVEIKEENGQTSYITKGDANDAPDDGEISKKDIIGKVLFDIPYLGYVVDFAKKPIGFMFLIIIPAAIIIYDEMRNIWLEIKKMRNKKTSRSDNNSDNNVIVLKKNHTQKMPLIRDIIVKKD